MYPKNNGEQLVWLCHVRRSEGDGGYSLVPCEFLVVRSSVVSWIQTEGVALRKIE